MKILVVGKIFSNLVNYFFVIKEIIKVIFLEKDDLNLNVCLI